jgi:hypothetical protein
MKFSRKWAMPSEDTFSIKPIGEFVKSYLAKSKISIDPFARNNRWASYTNDINPSTSADHHLDAVQFLRLLQVSNTKADLIILDPPYSPRQISECYKSLGMKVTQKDTQTGTFMKNLRDESNKLIELNGTVLSFGWNSVGMGINRGFEIEEILMVCGGGVHNDIICLAERKIK